MPAHDQQQPAESDIDIGPARYPEGDVRTRARRGSVSSALEMKVVGKPIARLRVRSGAAIAVICASLFGFCSTVYAAEFDPVSVGHDLVRTYCADCHATERTGDSPLAAAPHFRDLHLRYDVDNLSEALVEGIVTSHAEMPEFEFDPDQAAAIVAYLKSLEPLPK